MIYIVGKNEKIINEIKWYETDWLRAKYGDALEFAEQTDFRIATASSSDFSTNSGLDAELVKRFPEDFLLPSEFKIEDNIFFLISMDEHMNVTQKLLKRAFAALYVYRYKYNIVVSIPTGIGKLSDRGFIAEVGYLSTGQFSGVNLSKASLRGGNFDHMKLDGANLSSSDLSDSTFNFVSACRANLRNTRFSYCYMDECSFDYSKLDDRTCFMRASLCDVSFRSISGFVVDFSKTRMREIDFSRAKIGGSLFTEAILSHINLFATDLDRADFSGAILLNVTAHKKDRRSELN